MSKEACLTIPTNSSSYATWIEWHKSLKKCVGKKNANQLWMMNYDKETPGDSVEVRSYMKKQGVDLDRNALERLTDWGGGVYNWFGGAVDFTSGLTIAILAIIVGGAGLMIFNIVKTPEGSKRLAAGIATRGMSETGGLGIGGGGMKKLGM
tara:strand:- start:841 stop:1293 length:453 start_codon:yes stop_codon:yes gene_type:complete